MTRLPDFLRSRPALLAVAAILVAGLAAMFLWPSTEGEGAQQAAFTPPPATVSVAQAELREVTPAFTAPGDVIANRDSVVAAEVPGRIIRTLDIGDRVRRGGVIARIDDRNARLARDRAAADVQRLEADVAYRATRLARLQQLLVQEAESEAALDEAVSAHDQARFQLASARLALENAQLDLARTAVRSPFDGQVVERLIELGEYATPGRDIARVVGREGLEARVTVPIALAGSLSAGDSVEILADGVPRQARVRAVIETGDEVSRTVEVRAPFVGPGMKVGAAVSMTLPTGQPRSVVTVPRDALVLRDSGIFLYAVDGEGGTARRVDVEVGEAIGDLVEVTGDLAPGVDVVIRGGERLRDGQPVSIQTLTSTAPAATEDRNG